MNTTAIFAPYIITMNDDCPVLENHAVIIKGREILDILPNEQAKNIPTNQTLHLENHALMPGLINLHGHSAMTLLRGFADDLALMDWLNNHIWPTEGKNVSDAFVYDGSLLAMAEMVAGGTTTINDMYFFNAAVAKAGLLSGMRTFVGCTILEFPNAYAQNADEYIVKGLREQVPFYGDDLIRFVLAPHAPYTVSDATFRKVVDLTEKYDMLIHCHIHETNDEISGSLKEYGVRPIERLNQLGVINSRLIAAHGVHLTDEEIALFAEKGASVAHNPASNMKLASGFAPVVKMLQNGVNVGLGTDGAASNNKLDMFAEMRLAALIAKGFSGSPTDLTAYETLKMATVNGAKALHLDDKIGRLKKGMRADMIAVDLSDITTQPVFNPVSHIVYAADRSQVDFVWVNGEMLLKNKQFTRIDLEEMKAKARFWQNRIQEK
ncbi:MAG: TRZ/ATZ family hydrolase [Neisseriaceae bacterium]|nr:TRZ/ATZ family hydrolase [Neisseriaceae bacterium]